jgi:hypothetical protein
MHIISEYVACVAPLFPLNTLLFGLCAMILTIRPEIMRPGRTSREIQQNGTNCFSRSAVLDARGRAVGC